MNGESQAPERYDTQWCLDAARNRTVRRRLSSPYGPLSTSRAGSWMIYHEMASSLPTSIPEARQNVESRFGLPLVLEVPNEMAQ
jgi:hypothetical protein